MPLTNLDKVNKFIVPYAPVQGRIAIPGVDIDEEPCIIFLNQLWVPVINAVLEVLLQEDTWEDDIFDADYAIQQIYSLQEQMALCLPMEEKLSSQFQLRQNPDDPCILQQSFDYGVTFNDCFNFSLCLPDAKSITDQSTTINQFFEDKLTMINYKSNNGGSTYYNTILGDAATESNWTVGVDEGYCWAYGQFIRLAIKFIQDLNARNINDQSNEQKRNEIIANSLALAAAAAGVVAVVASGGTALALFGTFTSIGVGLGSAALTFYTSVSGGQSVPEIDPTNAVINELICAIKDYVKSLTGINQDPYLEEFVDYGYASMSQPAKDLFDDIVPFFTYNEAPTILFTLLKDAYDLRGSNTLPDCPCSLVACTGFVYTWNQTGATPADWSGYAFDKDTQSTYEAVSRGSNAEWTYTNAETPWYELRVLYDGLDCVPENISAVFARQTANSIVCSIYVHSPDTNNWINVASYSRGTGGALTVIALGWSNDLGLRIDAIEFRNFTREPVLQYSAMNT